VPVSVLTIASARAQGLTKDHLYAQVRNGTLERVGRGVFIDPNALDPTLWSLAAASARQPAATLCLTSALARHDLTDAIPQTTDIALPRGTRPPAGFAHVTWHWFGPGTFQLGRGPLPTSECPGLYCYSPERTIIDCFRLAGREGHEQANLALRRWLAKPGNSPATLLDLATHFPHAYGPIRRALEILL
jgi:predicted transcriptional regulator of viral defense system